MTWPPRWWAHYAQRQREERVGVARLERHVEQLAGQLRVHMLATDTRLGIYDVLIPKVLADLNANLKALASSQTRIADLLEGKAGERPQVHLVPLGAPPLTMHSEEDVA